MVFKMNTEDKDMDSIPYFRNFMSRFSEASKKQYITKISYYKSWLENNKQITDLLKARYEDVEEFFRTDINKRNVKITTKEYWRIIINSYYEFVGKIYKKKLRKDFINPVPDHDLYAFDTERDVTINDLLDAGKLLDHEDANRILSHFYFYDFQMFIITGLLLYTGARITEIMSLLEANLNLEHCLIFNLIKRTKYKSKYGVYFFPQFFLKYIKIYLEEKNEISPGNKHVFPSKSKKGEKSYLSVRNVQSKLKKASRLLDITSNVSPHKFRKLINEERRKKGVAPLERTILLNHAPQSVEARNYLPSLKQIQELKKIYIRTFPFPKFKLKLS